MNVLIVEDSYSARQLLRITFQHYGCTVIEAQDGEDGFAQAARHTPDIIISDALMPRMDGFQLLRALKADPELKSIPFIFYSSTYTGDKESELALSLGAEAFVPKPTEPDELWEKTSAIMKEWEARQRRPAHPAIDESDEQYLREYSRIVASKLEEKVQELEDALSLRIQAEEQLRRLNAGLEERVALEVEKNREKDRIMAHQGRLVAMGEMLSNISHQWRQPLNNVSLIVQNLLMECEEGTLSSDSCRSYVSECLKALTYMSRTIDSFRVFYHPDQERRLFALHSAVADTISLVREELEYNGINIETVGDKDSFVNGYKNEFSQVLLNIVVNAKEAILRQQPAVPHIEIVCSQKEEKALITVSDNGGGIAPEHTDKIFDPYFTTKFKSQGTGVGLYMAKMIIERHMGGRISVTNSAVGAEVVIELPLVRQTDNEVQP
ncbi:MAG: hybrid sensor histidine kinase/response regulator [Desulfuromonadaceae bacterium]|nr:hybrid sensor histidine kinase/response regulator [Desulfuromonadaceae bacterium]MDD5107617.1 hybrid sensor histidine kinase/response regulator [Desulfuromonadaceae bacterium]